MRIFMKHFYQYYSIGLISLITLNTPAISNSADSSKASIIKEEVYVQSPTDSDQDGKLDLIYVSVERSSNSKALPSLLTVSPYSLGSNEVKFYNVNMDLLPQDQPVNSNEIAAKYFDVQNYLSESKKAYQDVLEFVDSNRPNYATIKADSVGTGRSKGCPTSGDMAETLASKAIIDWLNGSAKAFTKNGQEVKATWSNGSVGMIGVSYNGTLPTMVATTGVKGLKAIVPIAAISSWYDYYRANGLVVGPGGWIGEDADVLAKYVVRKNHNCKANMDKITKEMGREHGDYDEFWKNRDYLPKAGAIKAATFIVHGQSDWNVKQVHATNLWTAMEKESSAPKRAFFHKGGHSFPNSHDLRKKVNDWMDRYVGGVNNGLDEANIVEVESKDGSLTTQAQWPSEKTQKHTYFFNPNSSLSSTNIAHKGKFSDSGRTKKITDLSQSPKKANNGRLVFLTESLNSEKLISGTSKINLKLAVSNRKAANITVVLVDYDSRNQGTIITRGWADPQNHSDISKGEYLEPGKFYNLSFKLEPKQYKIKKGHKLGLLIAGTDYNYTIRPKNGTELDFDFDSESNIKIWMD